ncbi:MAG: cysteine desulfurase family protein [Proteobacteria bacterium]|nr:cysteine desulfurase family protein [Pseudomonadota bacterium]
MDRIYLDHASTTPVDRQVLDAMLPYFIEQFGNPSSALIEEGGMPNKAIDEARNKVAKLVNAEKEEIIFTGSATESNNLAIKGLALANKDKGKKILISDIEHYSVMNQADFLRKFGFEVDFIKVDNYGIVDLEDLKNKLTDNTILVSVMHANLEIGTIEPIEEIALFLMERGVLLHSDGTGTCGRIPVDVKNLGVDTMTISPHQFYGPKGVAALYMKRGTKLISFIQGGSQEMGYRAGTENVPGIVGFGEAARIAMEEMDERVEGLTRLSRRLWDGLASSIEYIHFTGHPTKRLPGHTSFWIEFVEGESLLLWLNLNGIASASGSACASNMMAVDETGLRASHVLTAVGVPPEICSGSISFSLGKDNKTEEVEHVLSVIPGIVKRLMGMSPLYEKARKSGISMGKEV